jgi:hypothetical protein
MTRRLALGDIDKSVKQWRELVVQTLNALIDGAGGSGAGGGTVGGGFGSVAVPNVLGLSPGTLINYKNGQVKLADRTAGLRCTHVVGLTSGGAAIAYSAWALGPVKLDGLGSGDVVYLGTGGKGTLKRPDLSTDGDVIDQVIGLRAQTLTSGIVQCQVSVEDRLFTV